MKIPISRVGSAPKLQKSVDKLPFTGLFPGVYSRCYIATTSVKWGAEGGQEEAQSKEDPANDETHNVLWEMIEIEG